MDGTQLRRRADGRLDDAFGAVKPGRYQFEYPRAARLAAGVFDGPAALCQVRHHGRTGIGRVELTVVVTSS